MQKQLNNTSALEIRDNETHKTVSRIM